MTVRTRFAPSPTGYMHVGGARTALFAWLIARQAKGQFILRLEDTDKAREVEGSDQHIMDTLKWLGLEWDEGPDKDGGAHGPYRQSQRLDTYREWANKLIQSGRAYADPFSEAELGRLRDEAKASKMPFLFREHRPDNPPTWDGKQPLRFLSEPKDYSWHDEVMGDLNSGAEAVDDFILIKSDGFPTYNFAHIVDDHLMQVSHVIRSQEFLPSVPKYLNLYEALGIDRPALATLPYVLGPDGKKKLSKRDGAKDVLDYAREGYLPEAVANYLASLGWNDGSEQEIFSLEELKAKFDIKRVQRSGARFDPEKLAWMNWQHFKRGIEHTGLSPTTAKIQIEPELSQQLAGQDLDAAARLAVSKAGDVAEFFGQLKIFTEEPAPLAPDTLIKLELSPDEGKRQLAVAIEALGGEETFDAKFCEDRLRAAMDQHQFQPRQFLNLVRWAVSGQPVSPSLFELLAVLGREATLKRLDSAL